MLKLPNYKIRQLRNKIFHEKMYNKAYREWLIKSLGHLIEKWIYNQYHVYLIIPDLWHVEVINE